MEATRSSSTPTAASLSMNLSTGARTRSAFRNAIGDLTFRGTAVHATAVEFMSQQMQRVYYEKITFLPE